MNTLEEKMFELEPKILRQNVNVLSALQVIATLAIEGERQRILDELPEEESLLQYSGSISDEEAMAKSEGYNLCLQEVRNIISKPNI